MKSILMVHGFGLRGRFWDLLATQFPANEFLLHAPDLAYRSPGEAVALLTSEAAALRERSGEHPVIVGHSLGGIMTALALKSHPELFAKAVIISSPFGERKQGPAELFIRFLLKYRLLPGALVRSRFFGPAIPKAAQKDLFDAAVPEAKELLELVSSGRWFHNSAFGTPLEKPVLGICSESDAIVPAPETRAFLEAVGGRLISYPKHDQIGHDDLAVSNEVAARVAKDILEFIAS